MKKYSVIIMLVIAFMLASCTPLIIKDSQPNYTSDNQENVQTDEQSNSQVSNETATPAHQATDNKAASDPTPESTPIAPTPEPTQEFIENHGPAHEDLMYQWFLIKFNDVDVRSDLIFYEITRSMMNRSAYGNSANYIDYMYTYSNGVIDFGDGLHDVILDQDMLYFINQSTNETWVLERVDEQKLQERIREYDTSGSPGGAVDPDEYIFSPVTGSGRRGNPFLPDEEPMHYYQYEAMINILTSSTWVEYSYMQFDGTHEDTFLVLTDLAFFPDGTFVRENSYGRIIGGYDIGLNDSGLPTLELMYGDTIEYYPNIYIEYNSDTKWYYLYLSDEGYGNPDCYTVFEGITHK